MSLPLRRERAALAAEVDELRRPIVKAEPASESAAMRHLIIERIGAVAAKNLERRLREPAGNNLAALGDSLKLDGPFSDSDNFATSPRRKHGTI